MICKSTSFFFVRERSVNEFFEGPVLDGRVFIKTSSKKLLISALLHAGRDTVRKRHTAIRVKYQGLL